MKRSLLACFAILIGVQAAAASDIDGLYRPVGEAFKGWDCKTVGQDGGAMAIQGNQIFGVESLCKLNNPVKVTGMSAILYDATCGGEGYEWSQRIMLMPSEKGIYNISDKFATEWQRCP